MCNQDRHFHWRRMSAPDMASVTLVASQVHPDYPEDERVFAERLALYPDGCLLLEAGKQIAGYVISHPWRERQPPALNSLLQALPATPSTYYIHDVALLPAARGLGAASQLVDILMQLAQAADLATMSLVAVNDSHAFWARHGFVSIEDPALQEKLHSYDTAARFLAKEVARR
ncbi:Putative acetyltransferase [Herminiimonas arsenicoxydans]|uniref:Acetyltransferase n=1 Tax=Herminiimonas arsenicoxydans TaxID=204773 RepID=A4G8K1_HERAR|nr:Putative acetyltransferase [Herminiimonas arsenicoxydans]